MPYDTLYRVGFLQFQGKGSYHKVVVPTFVNGYPVLVIDFVKQRFRRVYIYHKPLGVGPVEYVQEVV